jgi:hypothetical protein
VRKGINTIYVTIDFPLFSDTIALNGGGNMAEQPKLPQEIKVKISDEIKRGAYCNLMIVAHTKEEFIMDFILAGAPEAIVTARVIMSPGHMKRTVSALQENMKKYEQQFGKIAEAPEPITKRKMGFIKP